MYTSASVDMVVWNCQTKWHRRYKDFFRDASHLQTTKCVTVATSRQRHTCNRRLFRLWPNSTALYCVCDSAHCRRGFCRSADVTWRRIWHLQNIKGVILTGPGSVWFGNIVILTRPVQWTANAFTVRFATKVNRARMSRFSSVQYGGRVYAKITKL